MRLFAEDDDDEKLMLASQKCSSVLEAREILEQWCEENDCEIPFLQVFRLPLSFLGCIQAVFNTIHERILNPTKP